MSFVTKEVFKKLSCLPQLRISRSIVKTEKEEYKNVISILKINIVFSIFIELIIALMCVLFVVIAISLPEPESKKLFLYISLPLSGFFTIFSCFIMYKRAKTGLKRIKLAKSSGILFCRMKCTDKGTYDNDETLEYYLQFENDLVCKTNVKNFNSVSVLDTCMLICIKGDTEPPVL